MAEPLPKRPQSIATRVFLLGIVATEAVLFASEHFQWFTFNREKGITVLVTVVLVGVQIVVFLTGVGISRLLRWPWQFGLGTVFVLVVLTALPCGWLGSACRRARRQAALVQLIETEGGMVERCVVTPRSGKGAYYRSRQSLRAEGDTLAWIFGDDFFLDVRGISLETSTLVDQLHFFPHLKALRMGLSTTDSDVEKLVALRGLETVDLTGTQITDDSMVYLAGMPELATI